ncbi:MAG TPA: cobalamin B12-binding domain-containing protein [Peptococcaceae bacterium]|nr:cobalamin B12-binding domain-containing protein [Peptococcaceae bacterium]HPZ71291.1 cobalamin B12-binding domain-containing protein [Peptococcaceae bacterium]HQD54764.1 cobalamin B12-binding domain-containing protein [Peptococcaceae bacterium]
MVLQSGEKKIRVLISKAGLDGHEVGAKVVARALADAGMEVIYTGLRQTPEMIVDTAIQEDVDVIGISILSGAHMFFLPEILKLLAEKNADDIPVIAGGVIPVEDIGELKKAGIKEIFPAGSTMQEIVSYVKKLYQERQD